MWCIMSTTTVSVSTREAYNKPKTERVAKPPPNPGLQICFTVSKRSGEMDFPRRKPGSLINANLHGRRFRHPLGFVVFLEQLSFPLAANHPHRVHKAQPHSM